MKILKGVVIDIHEFLNTVEEWHSFAIGFCEILCPWRPQVRAVGKDLDYIQGEYHYYLFGRALGFVALMVILTALSIWIIGAIHG